MSQRPTVLVTGSEGYIGSALCPRLIAEGFQVVGLDACWFADGRLMPGPPRVHPLLRKDVRDVERRDLEGIDAIVHLAGLSNDPLGELDDRLTMAINHEATVRLGMLGRDAGVTRFVFSGSCSVYGANDRTPLDEDAPLDPRTAYARSKVRAEQDLFEISDLATVSLRNATVYGVGVRQRFDLVVPDLCGSAHVDREVRLRSDGSPWRPLIHVEDLCTAIVASLHAPRRTIDGRVFNCGRIHANYRVREIGEAVRAIFGTDVELRIGTDPDPDDRSYRVDFCRIAGGLPGFAPRWTLESGIAECRDVFAAIGLDGRTLRSERHHRLHRIRALLDQGLLAGDLRWTGDADEHMRRVETPEEIAA